MAGAALRLTIKLWRSVQCGAGESKRQQGARVGSASDDGAEAAQWRPSTANGVQAGHVHTLSQFSGGGSQLGLLLCSRPSKAT